MMDLLTIMAPEDHMYPLETTSTGQVKHSRHCKALFSRRDFQCHRCCELGLKSAPRGSWHERYFARKLGQMQQRFDWEMPEKHG